MKGGVDRSDDVLSSEILVDLGSIGLDEHSIEPDRVPRLKIHQFGLEMTGHTGAGKPARGVGSGDDFRIGDVAFGAFTAGSLGLIEDFRKEDRIKGEAALSMEFPKSGDLDWRGRSRASRLEIMGEISA